MVAVVKRSHAPLFWLLFGAGGMLAALVGPMLVFITGIAVPLGSPLQRELLSYPRAFALAQHWWAKGCLLLVVALFAWHAVHRIYHSLHDLGIRTGTFPKLICYGTALVLTVATVANLLAIGF
jgi:fumarate reductase subunit D